MYYFQDLRRGLNSVRKICREYNIPGVYGPIIELLDCEEKFFTAVEVTAGNRYVKNNFLPHPLVSPLSLVCSLSSSIYFVLSWTAYFTLLLRMMKYQLR